MTRILAGWKKGVQSLPAHETNLTVDSPSAPNIKLCLIVVAL